MLPRPEDNSLSMLSFLFPKKKMLCFYCPAKLSTEDDRRNHVIQVHPLRDPNGQLFIRSSYVKDQFECTICKNPLTSSSRQVHMKLFHSLKCAYCLLTFYTKEEKRNHESTHYTETEKSHHMMAAHHLGIEKISLDSKKSDRITANVDSKPSCSAEAKVRITANVDSKQSCSAEAKITANVDSKPSCSAEAKARITANVDSKQSCSAEAKALTQANNLQCNPCGKIFKTVKAKKNHMWYAHALTCDVCHAKITEKDTVEAHILRKHTHKCAVCEFTFWTFAQLQNHVQSALHLKCEFCLQVCSSPEKRERHLQLAHTNICKMCPNTEFKSNAEKNTHIQTHHKCDICGMSSATIDEKTKHMQRTHNFSCKKCHKVFKLKTERRKHLCTIAKRQYAYTSSSCRDVFNTAEELQDHCAQPTPCIKCCACPAVFQSEQERDAHIFTQHKELLHCNICNLFCLSTELKSKHDQDNHDFSCTYCKKVYPSETLRNQHMPQCFHQINVNFKLGNNTRPSYNFKCEGCNSLWETSTELYEHHQRAHTINCNICNEIFEFEMQRLQHFADKHLVKSEVSLPLTNTEKYPCPLCGLSLSTSDERYQHINLMHVWNCTVCSKSFQTEIDKNQHVVLVHLHQCELCKETFNTDSSLDRHLEMMHRWYCEQCVDNEVYTSEASLQRHENFAHYDNSYYDKSHLCSECDQMFTSEEILVNHYREQHVPFGPRVFFDITVEGTHMGRIVMELREDVVPRTSENFLRLCTGQHGFGYKGSTFHHIIPNHIWQGGDITHDNGEGGMSIYGRYFDDENFKLKHSGPGILSMANMGANRNHSQFCISMVKMPMLDNNKVVFGRVVSGMDVLKRIEVFASVTGKPSKTIVIGNCGQLQCL